uniref:M48 family metallopeptidase n=1 Tax=Pelomonas sp. KK5 TaxID=1855730 RepID=UPI001301A2E4
MTPERFQDLVGRLETMSAASPGRYRGTVFALTLLGFLLIALVVCGLGAGLVALLGIAAWVALQGSAALILLFKLGKLLVLLAVGLWMMLKTTAGALFVRLAPPQGRELTRGEAPALFAALDRMRVQMRGPAFHQVLLVDGVNAAVMQRPAFGLVGWPRNYLLLGLPLLEGMSEDEALAVVAHEYGHLAGSHSHFAAFVYRLRLAWATLLAHLEQQTGRLSLWLSAPLLRFVPYYNAYTFVLARSDEYAADAAAAALVGRDAACAALKRTQILGARHERFMGEVFNGIAQEPAPPADLTVRWADSLAQAPAQADVQLWLGQALDRSGRATDTHPTLRLRLAALRSTGEAPEDAPAPLSGASAAQAWLGASLPELRAAFARDWAERVREP